MAKRKNKEGNWYNFRSPSGGCQYEIEFKEALNKVQYKSSNSLFWGNNTLNEADVVLSNKSQALWQEATMENNWKWIEDAIISTCREVLSRKKYWYKEWNRIDTSNKTHEVKNKTIADKNTQTGTQKVNVQAKYKEAKTSE